MDNKNNKYKCMIDGMVLDENLGNSIGTKIGGVSEKDFNLYIKRANRRKKCKIIMFLVLPFIVTMFLIILTRIGLTSPMDIVSQYIKALEQNELTVAEQFTTEEYDIEQDYKIVKKTRVSQVLKEEKNLENSKIRSVEVVIKYPQVLDSESNWFKDIVYHFSYSLKKIKGKWYIYERKTISSQ